jgi:hypothetical protein
MNIYDITESNKKAWNEDLKYHQKARGEYLVNGFLSLDFTIFDRDCDMIKFYINLADKKQLTPYVTEFKEYI